MIWEVSQVVFTSMIIDNQLLAKLMNYLVFLDEALDSTAMLSSPCHLQHHLSQSAGLVSFAGAIAWRSRLQMFVLMTRWRNIPAEPLVASIFFIYSRIQTLSWLDSKRLKLQIWWLSPRIRSINPCLKHDNSIGMTIVFFLLALKFNFNAINHLHLHVQGDWDYEDFKDDTSLWAATADSKTMKLELDCY